MTAYNEPRFLVAGDQAIVVELGDAIAIGWKNDTALALEDS